MKRWLPFLVLISLACVLPSLPLETPTQETGISETIGLTQTPSIAIQPTFTPTPLTSEILTQVESPGLYPDSINVYPSDLFPNDHYSIDVAPQIPPEMTETMTLTVRFPDGTSKQQTIMPTGLDGERRARFQWVNQIPDGTSPLTLTFTLDYQADLTSGVTQTVSLTTYNDVLPLSLLPPPEPEAQWELTRTVGFVVHYVTGTRAERELDYVVSEANQAYNDITAYLGKSMEDVDIYILDRVIGQGGYASSDWVAISFPDRVYSPIGLGPLLKHELTHRLDSAIGCSDAPAFLREGLAVYLAGGHYREEPLITKASTAASNGYSTSITQLIADFYIQQHEISYLEAGAFISYVSEQYGWEGIKLLCEVSSNIEGNDLDKMNAASQALADMDAANLVELFRMWLSQQPVKPIHHELFEYELHLMDLMRQYQLVYDPAAHFLKGILFSPEQGMRQEIVADFVRGPYTDEALVLELFLTAGQDAIVREDVQFLRTILSILDAVLLDGRKDIRVFDEVMKLVRYIRKLGYEPFNLVFLGKGQYEVAVLNLPNRSKTQVVHIGWNNDRWIITSAQ